MVKEISQTMLQNFEFTNYWLLFPKVFDDLHSADANFEMASSNTIQPMKIFYIFNIVTHQIAVIFVHGL